MRDFIRTLMFSLLSTGLAFGHSGYVAVVTHYLEERALGYIEYKVKIEIFKLPRGYRVLEKPQVPYDYEELQQVPLFPELDYTKVAEVGQCANVNRATVKIEIPVSQTNLATGTGFLVEMPINGKKVQGIITAKHVVTPSARESYKGNLSESLEGHAVADSINVISSNGSMSLNVEQYMEASDPRIDGEAIFIPYSGESLGVSPVSVSASTADPTEFQNATHIGFSGGRSTLDFYTSYPADQRVGAGSGLVARQAPHGRAEDVRGSSGGPVRDENCNIGGVNSALGRGHYFTSPLAPLFENPKLVENRTPYPSFRM